MNILRTIHDHYQDQGYNVQAQYHAYDENGETHHDPTPWSIHIETAHTAIHLTLRGTILTINAFAGPDHTEGRHPGIHTIDIADPKSLDKLDKIITEHCHE